MRFPFDMHEGRKQLPDSPEAILECCLLPPFFSLLYTSAKSKQRLTMVLVAGDTTDSSSLRFFSLQTRQPARTQDATKPQPTTSSSKRLHSFRTTTSVRTEVGVMDMRKNIRSLEDLKPMTITLLKQSHLEKISLPNLKVPPSTATDLNSGKYAQWQYVIRLGTTNLRSWRRYLTAKVNRPLSILRTHRRL